MKKILTLFGSILLFTGLKAQKDSMIQKETMPPLKQPASQSVKNTTGAVVKQKGNINVKGNPVLQSKGNIPQDSLATQMDPSKINKNVKLNKQR